MANADVGFYQTELRVLQNNCNGDNEKFLNLLAEIVSNDKNKIEKLEHKLGLAQERLRKVRSDTSWERNPDRMGGAFTDQEIQDSTGWK